MKVRDFFMVLIILELRDIKKDLTEIAGLSNLFFIQQFQCMFYMSASFPFIMSGND